MTDENNILKILGDDDDHVELQGGSWQNTGTEVDAISGLSFNVYTSANVTVQIQQDVQVDI